MIFATFLDLFLGFQLFLIFFWYIILGCVSSLNEQKWHEFLECAMLVN